jgi:hypothetical protein
MAGQMGLCGLRAGVAGIAATLGCLVGMPHQLGAQQQLAAPPGTPAAKTGADPTDFITRIEPSFEHRTLNDGTGLDILTVRTDLALRSNWSLRLDFPMLSFDPTAAATAAGYSRGFGLGDIVTQLAYKPYSSARLAVLTGFRVVIYSARLPGVGQGGTTYAPVAGVAFLLNPRWVIVPVAQWYLGNAFENDPLPGTRDRSELSIRAVTIYQVGKPNLTYLLLDPEYTRDFETETSTFTVNLEYGKVIGRGALILLRPSFGLDDAGGGIDWGFKFAFRQMRPGSFIIK